MDQGVAVPDVPQPCHALVDLYGQCEQVSGSREEEKGVLGTWEASDPQRDPGTCQSVADYFALQVTIVSPDPGTASGKIAGTQGDMEKADMVDGALAQRDGILPLSARQCPIQYFPAQLL